DGAPRAPGTARPRDGVPAGRRARPLARHEPHLRTRGPRATGGGGSGGHSERGHLPPSREPVPFPTPPPGPRPCPCHPPFAPAPPPFADPPLTAPRLPQATGTRAYAPDGRAPRRLIAREAPTMVGP